MPTHDSVCGLDSIATIGLGQGQVMGVDVLSDPASFQIDVLSYDQVDALGRSRGMVLNYIGLVKIGSLGHRAIFDSDTVLSGDDIPSLN